LTFNLLALIVLPFGDMNIDWLSSTC